MESISKHLCGTEVIAYRPRGNYRSNEMNSFLKKKGIGHKLTIPETPEHNCIAEHLNRAKNITYLSPKVQNDIISVIGYDVVQANVESWFLLSLGWQGL